MIRGSCRIAPAARQRATGTCDGAGGSAAGPGGPGSGARGCDQAAAGEGQEDPDDDSRGPDHGAGPAADPPDANGFDWSWADEPPDWLPPGAESNRPNPARMHDCLLGGKDGLSPDRDAAAELVRILPDEPVEARASRGFLLRAVHHLAEAGHSQFLELGAGLPQTPNLHEVIRRWQPQARVGYVDHDPTVLAYGRALASTPGVTWLRQDLRDPAAVLDDPQLRGLLDYRRPVALLLSGVLQFVAVSLAPEVLRMYVGRLAAGSHLVISVPSSDGISPPVAEQVGELYQRAGTAIHFRTRAQIEQLLDGLVPVGPGLVPAAGWPGGGRAGGRVLAAVARKP